MTLEKYCRTCKENKSISEFNKNKSEVDGHARKCRKCSKEKFKEHYNKNKKCREKIVKNNKRRRLELLQFIYNYYKEHPCVDCNNSNPLCLEFDHVRGTKSRAISDMLRNNNSIEKVKLEIEKCEVRCANCHRIKTAKDQNWYADVIK